MEIFALPKMLKITPEDSNFFGKINVVKRDIFVHFFKHSDEVLGSGQKEEEAETAYHGFIDDVSTLTFDLLLQKEKKQD